MERLAFLLGLIMITGIGYGIGYLFNRNSYGVKFKPELWALLGFIFGAQGLICGVVYGLCKLFYNNRK